MNIALFGYGGHAREVACQLNSDVTFFVDDAYAKEGCLPISSFDPSKFKMLVAVGDPTERQRVVNKLPPNTQFFTFIHPTAQVMDKRCQIGEGSFIAANCILTTNIRLGKHAILNRGAQIGHDVVVGDYFSAMPNAILSGNVTVGDRVYIGCNASVKEKITICSDVVIGLNTGIVKNITTSGKYIGSKFSKL